MKRFGKLFISVLVLVSTLFFAGTATAIWVPDDEGNLHWWEPPKESIHGILENPGILTQTDAEVLFMMDTSGSMNDEFDVLCQKIGDIVQGLKDRGINVEYKILGINATRNCATGTVHDSVANPTVNHVEDWGPAVEDVANQYPWKSGYARIAIPMSDEGAEDGDSWTSADDDAIDRAKEAAKKNSVGVIPVLGTPWNQSQFPYIKAGAEELADYCWGTVFLSTDPTNDLVNGIINAINQIFNPVSDKLDAQIFVDDAWASPYACGSINKIAGDIAFLVVQVLNGDVKEYDVDLEITYPNTWSLVADNLNPLMKRETLISDEKALDTETPDKDTQGTVLIKNVKVYKDNPNTPNDEGKSWQYIVKLIIPTSQAANTSHTVSARITSSSEVTSSILAAEDAFYINVKNTGDMILTNRHLLINRHTEGEDVTKILKEIHNIAHQRNAVVFYVDWWDEYDNFAKDKDDNFINPGGTGSDVASTPIKNWDRATDLVDYTSETTANEKVCTPIDRYTHYWADKMGGIDNNRYLLIVGGDEIIPFFRLSGIADSYFDDAWFYYDASTYTEDAADHSLAYSDVIYADTDGERYQDGKVESIFPGRIVGQDAERLLNSLNRVTEGPSKDDNVIISARNDENGKDKRFVKSARQIASDSKDLDYTVNSENGTDLYEKKFTFDELKKEFVHSFDHFVFRGHGKNDTASGRFDGSDFDGMVKVGEASTSISGLFLAYKPNFMLSACLMGQVDRNSESTATSGLMIYSLVRNNVRDIIGATTVSNGATNNKFLKSYYRSVIGKSGFLSKNIAPRTLGESVKQARNDTIAGILSPTKKYTRACGPIYVLYGTPWHKYIPVKDRKAQMNITRNDSHFRSLPAKDIQISTVMAVTTKTLQERVNLYSIKSEDTFDFIEIDGYDRLERGEETPVLPLKRFYITLPNDVTIQNVSLSPTNSVDLGALNIPVTSNAPPMPDSNYEYYLDAPDSIGLFDSLHSYYTYTTQDNTVLVIDLFPVSYNTVTDQATLYKDVDIQITYETNLKGVLQHAAPEKQFYTSGETINVPVSVENIIDQTTNFNVTIVLKDQLNNAVETKTTTISVDPATVTETTVQLQAPAKGGSYWVSTSVSDGTQVIGTSNEHINVNPGAISNFEIPRCVPGSTAQFSVTFKNQSTSQIEATFGLLIYDGSIKKAEFLPKVYNLSAGAEQTANFSWDIPDDFPSGDFLAVASVTCDGYATSASGAFGIGTLGEGWNLISLYQQPSDTSVAKVLEPIINRVESVWAFINGSWLVYDPDNPGFSDLTDMTAGYGYWLNMKIASNFSVSGSAPGKSINLNSGWNLVGYNSSTAQAIADALVSISGKVVSVWAYINSAWKVYDPANPGFSDLTTMEPGYGYWIKTTEACTWTLP